MVAKDADVQCPTLPNEVARAFVTGQTVRFLQVVVPKGLHQKDQQANRPALSPVIKAVGRHRRQTSGGREINTGRQNVCGGESALPVFKAVPAVDAPEAVTGQAAGGLLE